MSRVYLIGGLTSILAWLPVLYLGQDLLFWWTLDEIGNSHSTFLHFSPNIWLIDNSDEKRTSIHHRRMSQQLVGSWSCGGVGVRSVQKRGEIKHKSRGKQRCFVTTYDFFYHLSWNIPVCYSEKSFQLHSMHLPTLILTQYLILPTTADQFCLFSCLPQFSFLFKNQWTLQKLKVLAVLRAILWFIFWIPHIFSFT